MRKQYIYFVIVFSISCWYAQEVEFEAKGGLNISYLGALDLGYSSRIAYTLWKEQPNLLLHHFSVFQQN